jgi:hypothetical protein
MYFWCREFIVTHRHSHHAAQKATSGWRVITENYNRWCLLMCGTLTWWADETSGSSEGMGCDVTRRRWDSQGTRGRRGRLYFYVLGASGSVLEQCANSLLRSDTGTCTILRSRGSARVHEKRQNGRTNDDTRHSVGLRHKGCTNRPSRRHLMRFIACYMFRRL